MSPSLQLCASWASSRKNRRRFEVEAAQPLECLQIMIGRYPSIKKWAYKDGNLLPVIWFFVNDPDWKKKLTPDELGSQLEGWR